MEKNLEMGALEVNTTEEDFYLTTKFQFPQKDKQRIGIFGVKNTEKCFKKEFHPMTPDYCNDQIPLKDREMEG